MQLLETTNDDYYQRMSDNVALPPRSAWNPAFNDNIVHTEFIIVQSLFTLTYMTTAENQRAYVIK